MQRAPRAYHMAVIIVIITAIITGIANAIINTTHHHDQHGSSRLPRHHGSHRCHATSPLPHRGRDASCAIGRSIIMYRIGHPCGTAQAAPASSTHRRHERCACVRPSPGRLHPPIELQRRRIIGAGAWRHIDVLPTDHAAASTTALSLPVSEIVGSSSKYAAGSSSASGCVALAPSAL